MWGHQMCWLQYISLWIFFSKLFKWKPRRIHFIKCEIVNWLFTQVQPYQEHIHQSWLLFLFLRDSSALNTELLKSTWLDRWKPFTKQGEREARWMSGVSGNGSDHSRHPGIVAAAVAAKQSGGVCKYAVLFATSSPKGWEATGLLPGSVKGQHFG